MTIASFESETLENILPAPGEFRNSIPLSLSHCSFIQKSRATVEAILNRWDTRRLLIVGPCSIHDAVAARDYARRLRRLAEKVSDRFFLIMRAYFEKPRTITGWKGMLYDPDLNGSYQVEKGVRQTRQLLVDLTELEVPVACELLEINTSHYYSDFITWGCIGARTCASPPHRQLASSLNIPIGFKNSTEGNIDHAIHGVISAGLPHVYLGTSFSGQIMRVQSEGNPLCHIVLRGSRQGPNYSPDSVRIAMQKCTEAKIRDRFIIDCSHDNCAKRPREQIKVFQTVVQHILEGNDAIAGMMLESNLYEGAQPICFPLKYGISITDPCLSWETTEQLILEAYNRGS